MTRLFAVVFLFALVTVACNKDKYQTRPSLTLKSMGGNIVPAGAALSLEFEFTDKEGDVSDTLFLTKIRTNKIKVPTIRDVIEMPVPDFPKKTSGNLQVVLDHSFYLVSAQNPPKDPVTGQNQHDTLLLKFVLKDKANNKSDTVTAGPIVVLR